MTPLDESMLAKGAIIRFDLCAEVLTTLSMLHQPSAVLRVANTGPYAVLIGLDAPEAGSVRAGEWIKVRGTGSVPRGPSPIRYIISQVEACRRVAPPEMDNAERSMPQPIIDLC